MFKVNDRHATVRQCTTVQRLTYALYTQKRLGSEL